MKGNAILSINLYTYKFPRDLWSHKKYECCFFKCITPNSLAICYQRRKCLDEFTWFAFMVELWCLCSNHSSSRMSNMVYICSLRDSAGGSQNSRIQGKLGNTEKLPLKQKQQWKVFMPFVKFLECAFGVVCAPRYLILSIVELSDEYLSFYTVNLK